VSLTLAEVEENLGGMPLDLPQQFADALQRRYPARSWQLVKTTDVWPTVASVLAADGTLITADVAQVAVHELSSGNACVKCAQGLRRVSCVRLILLGDFPVAPDPLHATRRYF
jgi:hypothetical protein